MKEIFNGVYSEEGILYTINLVRGKKVYTESLVTRGKDEYREWVPFKSKLGAAIKKGLRTFPFKIDSAVLYLGSATGTTPSHLSDIITNGGIFCIEFSERMMRDFMKIVPDRENLIPILADARKPNLYADIGQVDIVYEDVAQPDLVRIGIENAKKFLKKGGYLMIAIKSQSIDVSKDPRKVYRESADELKKAGFQVVEMVELDPFEDHHAMIVARL